MSIATFLHYLFYCARRLLFPAALVLATVPVRAETVDAGAFEARVDRLLWQLVNDERYGHLQVAANYERLREALLAQACFVSAAPCQHDDRLMHDGQLMTSEITPEQERIIEQLLFSLHDASASITAPRAHLMISAAE